MKYSKHIFGTLLGATLMVAFVFMAAPQAEAAYGDQLQDRFRFQEQSQLHLQTRDDLYNYLQRLIALLELLRELREERFGDDANDDDDDIDQADDFNIITRSADDIGGTSATLRGRLQIDDADEVEVWFEFGTDSEDLDEDTNRMTLDDDEVFEEDVDDLDEDERYFYRAVGENENGERDHGAIVEFNTSEDNDVDEDDDTPDLTTRDADDIDEDSARLHGEVDMNDFDNGHVFFVWGTNEDMIEDVADDFDSYDDVDEEGEELQKEDVDDDLDDEDDYSDRVSGLDSDTEYFFAICVEYEDEDDDDTIACGNVENFETDED